MLKRVASKSTTPLLNKLNKSSAIHPGPGWSPVHVDQRLPAAACNIAQWRRGGPKGCAWKGGGGGGSQHAGANTEQGPRRKELCTNAAATPAQQPPPPPPHHQQQQQHHHLSLCYPPGASFTPGGGSTLRLDILSMDGTIIWEEMGAMVEADALMQALRARFKLCGWGGGCL